jgi:hypothetical protein
VSCSWLETDPGYTFKWSLAHRHCSSSLTSKTNKPRPFQTQNQVQHPHLQMQCRPGLFTAALPGASAPSPTHSLKATAG